MNNASLAQNVFLSMDANDPVFRKLKLLLLTGRRAEAIKLILEIDNRFKPTEALELMSRIMNTLTETNRFPDTKRGRQSPPDDEYVE